MPAEDSQPTPPPETDISSPQRKKPWGALLRIGFSVGILAFILSRVGLDEVLSQLRQVNPWLYALASVVYLSSVLIRALRWRVMLRPLGIETPLMELVRLYLIGFFWDTFLPSGFGGDVIKSIQLSRDTQQAERAITSVVAERVVGLLGTSLIALIVVVFSPGLVPLWVVGVIVSLASAIVVGGWLLRLDLLDWLEERFGFLRKITQNKTVRKFDAALKAYDNGAIMRGVLTSIPFTFSLIVVNFLIGLALNVRIPLVYFGVFVPVVSIVNLLPLSFNGIGVREYMYQLLFGAVGVLSGQAVAMAILFNLMRIGSGMLGGLLILVRNTRDLVTGEQRSG